MGFFEEHRADGSVRRGETATCAHCNSVFEVRDNLGLSVAFKLCPYEHKPLCKGCADEMDRTGNCSVYEKRLESIEKRDAWMLSQGIVIGRR